MTYPTTATYIPNPQLEDWPWDWDFRNQRPYDDHEQEPISADLPRGRSLRRERSTDSLLSQCLSEASLQHERDFTTRPRRASMRSTANPSPFRASSPYYPGVREELPDNFLAVVPPLQTRMQSHSRSHSAPRLAPLSDTALYASQGSSLEDSMKTPSKEKPKFANPKAKKGRGANFPSLPNSTEQLKICSECSKRIDRPSEMRKHVKRHNKVYGCTIDSCFKTFGSKFDWRRHETTQHLDLTFWLCSEEIDTYMTNSSRYQESFTRICAHTSYSIGAFTRHLVDTHRLASDAVSAKLQSYKVGGDTFWCGFCRAVIDLKRPGRVSERFDHIEHHFVTEGKGIEMWMHCQYL